MAKNILYMGTNGLSGENLRVRLVWNSILAFGIAPNPIVAGLFLMEGHHLPAYLAIWQILFLLMAVLIGNIFEIQKTAPIFLIGSAAYVFSEGVLIQGDIGIEFVLAAIGTVPMMLFKSDKKSLGLMVAMGVSIFLGLIYYLGGFSESGRVYLSDQIANSIKLICLLSYFAITVSVVVIFRRESINVQRDLLREQEDRHTSERLADIGRLSAGMAHEINNPAAIAMGSAQIIEQLVSAYNDQEKAPIMERTAAILRALDRIVVITRSLRHFSKDPNFHVENISISDAVDNLIRLMEGRCEALGIQVLVQGLRDDYVVPFSSSDLGQVLLSLMQNSLDALSQHQGERWIRIVVDSSEDAIDLKFYDSGSGIPEDMIPRIMSPFESTKEMGAGPGLGLSSSYGIMKSFSGDLIYDVNSPHTCFIVRMKRDSSFGDKLMDAS